MADLTKARASADNRRGGMTGSAPVCDCPESCACYAEGYDQSEALVSSPGEAETTPTQKNSGRRPLCSTSGAGGFLARIH